MNYLMIEPMAAAVSDRELILIASFCGRETADKLLFEGDEYHRLGRSPASISERGFDLEFGSGNYLSNHEDQGQPA